MEKNAFLSNSNLDMLYETLVELDQELVSIVNRYRQGMKHVYTHNVNVVFSLALNEMKILFFRDRTEGGNFSTT